MAQPRTACPVGARAALLGVLAVACIAGADAVPASTAAAADFFDSLGPGGYADYPMDVEEPLGPEELAPEATRPAVPEDPMGGPVPAPAPGPADFPAGAMSSIGGYVCGSFIAARTGHSLNLGLRTIRAMFE